jgi:DNA-directed RNA polymerase subunit RPC12/RpoP
MIYRCKNCGANSIYSPEKGTMYCPYCDSLDSEELAPGEGMTTCINCGEELTP